MQRDEIVLEVQVVLDIFKPLSCETGVWTHDVDNVRNKLRVIASNQGTALLLIIHARTKNVYIFCVRNLIGSSKRVTFGDIEYVRLVASNSLSNALLRPQQLEQSLPAYCKVWNTHIFGSFSMTSKKEVQESESACLFTSW